MKSIKLILCCFVLFFYQLSFGNHINRKDAIKIAKSDSVTKIKKIKRATLISDSITLSTFWVVEERLNYKKEKRKLKGPGWHNISIDILTINALNGEIVRREEMVVQRVHFTSDY